jgi:hypothetical protein
VNVKQAQPKPSANKKPINKKNEKVKQYDKYFDSEEI